MFSCRAFRKRGNIVRIKTQNKGVLIFWSEINRSPADRRTIKSGKFSINPSPINQRFLIGDVPKQLVFGLLLVGKLRSNASYPMPGIIIRRRML
jgi:hypothetical protein